MKKIINKKIFNNNQNKMIFNLKKINKNKILIKNSKMIIKIINNRQKI